MAHLGKSIDLYLMDGTADGRWQATLSNWNCNSYKIPRSDLKNCDDLPDLHAPGVYFLFGRDDETSRQFVYVGEGDDVLKRIQQAHSFEKDGSYWTEVVVLITPDGSLDKAKIKFLENRFHKIAVDSGRYIIKNGNTPPQSPVQKKVRDMLEEFIMNTQLIMPALGHKVFEPQPSARTEGNDDLLYFSRNKGAGGNAVGKIADDGFWVLKGSYISPKIADYLPAGIVKARQQYAEIIDKQGILQKDITFGSPSYAAGFVCGKNSNGLAEWKNKDGIPLKSLNDENGGKPPKKTSAKGKFSEPAAQKPISASENSHHKDIFHLSSKKITVKGYLTDDDHFVILKGSQMRRETRQSCSMSVINIRERLINEGQVKDFVFTMDVPFGSPSTAAAAAIGGETNGWEAWKNEENVPLDAIRQTRSSGSGG